MIKKNHWLILCVFLFPQLLWALEDQQAPDAAQYEMALNYAKDYRYKLILELLNKYQQVTRTKTIGYPFRRKPTQPWVK